MTRNSLRKTLQVLYLTMSVVYILSVQLNDSLTYYIKPLMMPLLMGYYLSSTPVRDKFLLRALVFCWLGDIFLMQVMGTGVDFLLGVLAFLAGQVSYIMCFRRLTWPRTQHGSPMFTFLTMSMAMVFAGYVFSLVFPLAGELQMPVLIYMIVIVSMFYHAVRRRERTSPGSFTSLVIGAAAFLVSDAVLALNKFHGSIPFEWFLVMSTYFSAQYLIVRGVLLHPAEQPVREAAYA